MGAGKPGDVKQYWPSFDQVIHWINASGGVAVLAHPKKYTMTRTKLCVMVHDFKTAGGKGIEIVSGAQSQEVTRDLVTIANKYSLLGSCGSDFHAPGGAWQELGAFTAMPDNVQPVWDCW